MWFGLTIVVVMCVGSGSLDSIRHGSTIKEEGQKRQTRFRKFHQYSEGTPEMSLKLYILLTTNQERGTILCISQRFLWF